MILGIGIDTVEIERFTHWSTYSEKKLSRIFSPQEIAYARACPAKTAERLAARFAAKEAFFKAAASIPHLQAVPFLQLCPNIWVDHTENGRPILQVAWNRLSSKIPQSPYLVNLSISHTKNTATAFIIIETIVC